MRRRVEARVGVFSDFGTIAPRLIHLGLAGRCSDSGSKAREGRRSKWREFRAHDSFPMQIEIAVTRWRHPTTLAEDFGVTEAREDDLYASAHWLLLRQEAIENRLATRPLERRRPGALRPHLDRL
jgi:hypothetical protein